MKLPNTCQNEGCTNTLHPGSRGYHVWPELQKGGMVVNHYECWPCWEKRRNGGVEPEKPAVVGRQAPPMDEFYRGRKVVFVPAVAGGDLGHEDVQRGVVSHTNGFDLVWVKFEPQLTLLGWYRTSNSGCRPEELFFEED
jgi:hypothetical protein